MTILPPRLADQPGPRYLAVADWIAEAVARGSLAEGAKLPPQRDLAYDLGLSLNTVTRAYAEAERRGLVRGEVGRGTYVRTGGPLRDGTVPQATLTRPDTGPIDFTLNLPAVGESAKCLAETCAELSSSSALADLLDYQAEGALQAHGEAGAAWIGRLGLDCTGRDIVVTTGAQHGVMVALMATLRPGDALMVEHLTYAPLKQMAHHLGLKLQPLAMDEQGLAPEDLDRACRTTSAKVLYCLPTLHTPTTATMPEDRRRTVADIARKHDVTIVEDDVFGFLPRERPPPVASFAPERSLFVTSVSKSLAPGLRIGYLRAPGAYRRAVDQAVALSCLMPPPLMAEIACRWMADGTADRLNDWQRREAQARQEIAGRILASHAYRSDPFCFSLWLPLPAPWRAETFRMEAEKRGVKVLTGEIFAVGQTAAPHAVRLCLGYEPERARVTAGLESLARLFEGPNGPGSSVV
jgi:DNA-binding transcriptional MocR family regulator